MTANRPPDPVPAEDEVLWRMLNTPPNPHGSPAAKPKRPTKPNKPET